MSRPPVSEAASELYEGLGVFTDLDEATGWQLLLFCEALTAGSLGAIHGYVTDSDDRPGWAIVLDPDQAPPETLPWLAQFVGVNATPAMSEAEMREAIKLPEGFQRGTLDALREAVEREIDGNAILIDERYQDNAYRLRVRTLLSETPDPPAVEAAILTQKPIGIVLTYEAIDGQDWADLRADHASWTDVTADYSTWFDARTDLP